MKTPKLFLAVLATGAIITSCQKSGLESGLKDESAAKKTKEDKISKAILEQISTLHFKNEKIRFIEFLLPDGKTKKKFLMEGNFLMDEEQFEKINSAKGNHKQYHSYDPNASQNRNIIGFTGCSVQGLNSKQRAALQRAVNKYNSLNIGFDFTLTFGTSYGPEDIVVYQNANEKIREVAGFPSSDDPYKYLKIFSGMEHYSISINQHVIPIK